MSRTPQTPAIQNTILANLIHYLREMLVRSRSFPGDSTCAARVMVTARDYNFITELNEFSITASKPAQRCLQFKQTPGMEAP